MNDMGGKGVGDDASASPPEHRLLAALVVSAYFDLRGRSPVERELAAQWFVGADAPIPASFALDTLGWEGAALRLAAEFKAARKGHTWPPSGSVWIMHGPGGRGARAVVELAAPDGVWVAVEGVRRMFLPRSAFGEGGAFRPCE